MTSIRDWVLREIDDVISAANNLRNEIFKHQGNKRTNRDKSIEIENDLLRNALNNIKNEFEYVASTGGVKEWRTALEHAHAAAENILKQLIRVNN